MGFSIFRSTGEIRVLKYCHIYIRISAERCKPIGAVDPKLYIRAMFVSLTKTDVDRLGLRHISDGAFCNVCIV